MEQSIKSEIIEKDFSTCIQTDATKTGDVKNELVDFCEFSDPEHIPDHFFDDLLEDRFAESLVETVAEVKYADQLKLDEVAEPSKKYPNSNCRSHSKDESKVERRNKSTKRERRRSRSSDEQRNSNRKRSSSVSRSNRVVVRSRSRSTDRSRHSKRYRRSPKRHSPVPKRERRSISSDRNSRDASRSRLGRSRRSSRVSRKSPSDCLPERKSFFDEITEKLQMPFHERELLKRKVQIDLTQSNISDLSPFHGLSKENLTDYRTTYSSSLHAQIPFSSVQYNESNVYNPSFSQSLSQSLDVPCAEISNELSGELHCLQVNHTSVHKKDDTQIAFPVFKKIKLEKKLDQRGSVPFQNISDKRRKSIELSTLVINQLKTSEKSQLLKKFIFTSTVATLKSSTEVKKLMNRSPLHLVNNVAFKFNTICSKLDLGNWCLQNLSRRTSKVAKVVGINAGQLLERIQISNFKLKNQKLKKHGEVEEKIKSSFFANSMTQTDDIHCQKCSARGINRGYEIGVQAKPYTADIGSQTEETNEDLPLMKLITKLNENQLLALNDFAELTREPSGSTAVEMYHIRDRMLNIYNLSQRPLIHPTVNTNSLQRTTSINNLDVHENINTRIYKQNEYFRNPSNNALPTFYGRGAHRR